VEAGDNTSILIPASRKRQVALALLCVWVEGKQPKLGDRLKLFSFIFFKLLWVLYFSLQFYFSLKVLNDNDGEMNRLLSLSPRGPPPSLSTKYKCHINNHLDHML
jgi:hypothetical protein